MMKSMRLIFAGAGWAALSLVAVTTTAHAQQASGNDLRDIRIGMSIGDLPTAGYVNFACANDRGTRSPRGRTGRNVLQRTMGCTRSGLTTTPRAAGKARSLPDIRRF